MDKALSIVWYELPVSANQRFDMGALGVCICGCGLCFGAKIYTDANLCVELGHWIFHDVAGDLESQRATYGNFASGDSAQPDRVFWRSIYLHAQ